MKVCPTSASEIDFDKDSILIVISAVATERRWFENECGQLRNLRFFPSSANFIMIELPDENRLGDFGRYLRQRGYLVRDLGMLPGCQPGFYRIGLRCHQDGDAEADAGASGSFILAVLLYKAHKIWFLICTVAFAVSVVALVRFQEEQKYEEYGNDQEWVGTPRIDRPLYPSMYCRVSDKEGRLFLGVGAATLF